MPNGIIDSFRGPNRFLSNFYPAEVRLDGLPYPTVEHAYQAAKTLDSAARAYIRHASTPGEAKILGRNLRLNLTPGWALVRETVMRELVLQKFRDHPMLWRLLDATGEADLVEGNHHGDAFWGVCNGVGSNKLGIILMETRRALRADKGA